LTYQRQTLTIKQGHTQKMQRDSFGGGELFQVQLPRSWGKIFFTQNFKAMVSIRGKGFKFEHWGGYKQPFTTHTSLTRAVLRRL
jgi:hypothetical protein